MNILFQNPYRLIGVLAGTSAKELDRTVRRLKHFLEAEEEPEEDFSFPTLGKFERNIALVANAISQIDLDKDKLDTSLFWFYKGNEITDEPAFDTIKEGDLEASKDIWSKLTTDKELTDKNYSAFHNLSTLLLFTSFNGKTVNEGMLSNAISIKLKLIDSDFFNNFVLKITDHTHRINKKDIQLNFLNTLQKELTSEIYISNEKFFEIVSTLDFSNKDLFINSFIQTPIDTLERKIEESKEKRKVEKPTLISSGAILFNESQKILKELSNLIGKDDHKYIRISDKVAQEVMQCGVDYFLHFRETDHDPGEESLRLVQKASSLAFGSIAIQRCEENIEGIKEWNDDKNNRQKYKPIEDDLLFINNELEKFQLKSISVSNANSLVSQCKPKLINIMNQLGENDEMFLSMSNAVAGNATGMAILFFNQEMEKFINGPFYKFYQYGSNIPNDLTENVKFVTEALTQISSLHMKRVTRKHLESNFYTILDTASKIGISTRNYNLNSPHVSRKKGNSKTSENVNVWDVTPSTSKRNFKTYLTRFYIPIMKIGPLIVGIIFLYTIVINWGSGYSNCMGMIIFMFGISYLFYIIQKNM